MNWQYMSGLLQSEMASGIVATAMVRLALAAILGGVIGLERELRHRPAGLRTNMFICIGAAMFTILSDALAVEHLGDHTRISAQIIPGIGFIGAGSILHTRGLTSGLTTAATLFVVASVGMATGDGPIRADVEPEDSADKLRSYRAQRGGHHARSQPHSGAPTSHDAKCRKWQHRPARASTV
jgi:hypothetical protein